MNLVKIGPWFTQGESSDEIKEMFDNFINSRNDNTSFPRVDIYENENNLYLTAELPGISKDDVKLVLKDGILYLSGKIKEEFENDDKIIAHSNERFFGEFNRKFNLPEDVNPEKISANFENGLLKIHIEKIKPEKPKEINIKVK